MPNNEHHMLNAQLRNHSALKIAYLMLSVFRRHQPRVKRQGTAAVQDARAMSRERYKSASTLSLANLHSPSSILASPRGVSLNVAWTVFLFGFGPLFSARMLADMRFLMLNWRDPKNPLSGGAERVTQAYLAALAKRGHEVFWFANSFPNCLPEETIGQIRVVRGGGMGTSVLKAVQWYRGQPRFDLVMDQHHGIPWYTPWWCGTNCVSYIHEVLGPIWNAFYPWPISTVGRLQERWTHWLYRNIPFWTASSCTRDILLSHGVKSVKLIPYGVYTVALATLPEKPLDLPLRLIVVSRLAPNKRIDHAVRALKCLGDRGIDAQLTIVGTGEEEGRLRSLAGELQLGKRVLFTGPLSEADKDEQLRRAHFLLHTSMREGWGLNVIEANAMGTPGVVYPVAGLIESTLHDETGMISEQETPDSLADALAKLLKSPEKYQGYRVKAWERAKTLHWDNVLPMASEWLEQQARHRTS
jgi:glycosyltransferase involved in cell wall biosynthesis